MPKIRVEVEVPDGNYCDCVDDYCPLCECNIWGEGYCYLFGCDLEMDKENGYYRKRCDKCKQAEVEDANK